MMKRDILVLVFVIGICFGCSDYTTTQLDDHAVVSGATPDNVYSYIFYFSFCKYACSSPSPVCTVSYDPDDNKCYVYSTNCGGSCSTEPSSGWTVYTTTCTEVECPALSDPLNGVVDTSAGTSSGDQAIYTCNIGYVLYGWSVTTCGSDGNWDNSAPTCSLVDCGSLSNPTDGIVSFTLTTYGSQANYDCNTGYSLSGSSVRMCGSDGNWDYSAPTCSLVDCGSLSNPTYGTVSFTLTTYGSPANYDCNTGYSLSGSSVRTCGSDGNWDNSAPTCSIVDCGSLSNPTDGTVSFTLTTYGSQANYDCNTGYSLSSSSVRTCGSDGNWDNSAPSCSLVDCGSLSNPPDGTVSFTLTTYGSQANYDCNTGYSLSSSSVRTCGLDGNWDNSALMCSLVDCGSLSNPTDGTVSSTFTTYGSQAHYDCNVGYTLSGSSVTTCGSDGNWDNSAPMCSLVDCGSLSNPTYGTVSFTLTTYGSQANYDCNTGYSLSSSSLRTCGSDGNWDNSALVCSLVDCGSLSNPTDGTVSFTLTTYGSQADYDCNVGYTLSGSSVTTCGSDGNWDNLAPTCPPVDCGSLTTPIFGSVTYTKTTYGAQANYTCNTGYILTGSNSRSCLLNGTWEFIEPECKSTDCGFLTDPVNGRVYTPAGTTFGNKATFSCDSGYAHSHAAPRICQATSKWSGTSPTCNLEECPALSDPPNGVVDTSAGTSYGDQAIYTCHIGYVLFGSSVTTCGSDGNWDNSAPTCSLVDCGSLSNQTDGTVSFVLTTYGSQANYDCNTGYSLNGSSVRVCGSDGNWDNSAPICTPVDCGSLANPVFGSVTYTETTYGALANYTCNSGYILMGSNSRSCLSNGTWESKEPECVSTGATTTTTAAPLPQKLYIMPCICNTNKTFVNMTQEEIVQQLIADTKIDTKETSLAQYKLKSRSDPRMSSKMIGMVAIVVLSVMGGLILFCDLLTMRATLRSLED